MYYYTTRVKKRQMKCPTPASANISHTLVPDSTPVAHFRHPYGCNPTPFPRKWLFPPHLQRAFFPDLRIRPCDPTGAQLPTAGGELGQHTWAGTNLRSLTPRRGLCTHSQTEPAADSPGIPVSRAPISLLPAQGQPRAPSALGARRTR